MMRFQSGRRDSLRALVLLHVCVCAITGSAQAVLAENSGLFGPYQTHTPPGLLDVSAAALAVGDLNGDGRQDVAMVGADNYDAMSLFVFLQQADGMLTPVKHAYASNSYDVRSIAIGDINGDGRNDVIAGHIANGLEIFLQGADGRLAGAALYPGYQFADVAIADVDGDGRNDIAGIAWSGSSSAVGVLYQNVDGTLHQVDEIPLEQFHDYNQLKLGDVNGDGLKDVVLLRRNGGEFAGRSNVTVYPRLASGGFGPAVDYTTVLDAGVDSTLRGHATAVDLGDVNGDGRLDVVVGCVTHQALYIAVLAQNASGALNPMQQYPLAAGAVPEELSVGDVNGDGRQDVVVNTTFRYVMGVLLQGANGQLGAMEAYATPDASNASSTHGIGFGDLTADNLSDVVLLDANYGLTVFPRVAAVSGADVAVSIQTIGATVQVGDPVAFDLMVRNFGSTSADNVTLSAAIPQSTTFVSAPGCTRAAGMLKCNLGNLAAGSSSQTRVTLRTTCAGRVVLTATAVTTSAEANNANNSASASVEAVAPNRPPVANAGADITVDGRATVTLNGSGSYDVEHGPITAAWRQVSGPAVTLKNANGLKPSFVAPAVANRQSVQLVFELAVTDNQGARATDRVTVSVGRR